MIARMPAGRWLVGIALTAALLTALPVWAEDEVLEQTNDGETTYWVPIASAFYAQPEEIKPTFPEGDGPPTFADKNFIAPPFRFTLNPSPADRSPTIDTDWLVLSRNLDEGDSASAWFMARENGKPRLWVHRSHNEEYMAGYVKSVRLYIIVDVDVPRELFPIKDKPTGPVRRQLIADNVRVISGKIEITELNDVSVSGRYGKPASEAPLAASAISDVTIAQLGKGVQLEFVPRRETISNGDRLDGVIQVSFELELEAGSELGLETPERKKLKGAIRFAIGSQYVDIVKLQGESEGESK